jgi:hypothetical protein
MSDKEPVMFVQQADQMETVTNIILAGHIRNGRNDRMAPNRWNKLYLIPLSSMLLVSCSSEGPATRPVANKSAARTLGKDAIAAKKVATDNEKSSGQLKQIDPAPIPKSKPVIISQRDELSQNTPVCIYTIRYPGKIDHEIAWRGNQCKELSADFISVGALARTGALKKLDAQTQSELSEYHKTAVFYIEGEFTASIYPLNVAGVPHEVSVAD